MADLLTKLSSKYGCDKSDKKHKYTPKYHTRFKEHRNDKFNMLEFGFGKGKSIRMWLDYFTNANIVSVDIRDNPKGKVFQNKRFEYVQGSQIDVLKMGQVICSYREFFLIIDDASHVPEDQQYTFGFMFPFVEDGGWYVIEDLKCKRSHSTELPECPKTIPVLNKFIKTGIFDSPCLNKNQKQYIQEHVESVEIFDKIAFIRKKK